MSDVVKNFRDQHPGLDFAAGFIPGVGEAQDAHDLFYAIKGRDLLGAGLALAGFIIPGFTGGQIKKGVKLVKRGLTKPTSEVAVKASKSKRRELPENLKKLGWKEIDGRIFDTKGKEYAYNSEGRLNPIEKHAETQARLDRSKQRENRAKAIAKKKKEMIREHNDRAEEFRQKSGLDYSLENWKSLAPGHKMSDLEIELFTQKSFPEFVETYNELIKSGKLIRQPNGRYTAHFDSPVSPDINPKSKLAETWGAGYRKDLNNLETMYYIQANSPQGRNLLYNGIPMRSGIKDPHNFEVGGDKQNYEKWFDSDPRGSSAYGQLQVWGLPVKPSIINSEWDDNIRLIKRQTANPTSNAWAGPNRPIAAYLSKDRAHSVNVSEGPLIDEFATTKVANKENPVKGVFTVVGPDIPVKSMFGGSGQYDISPENRYKPFMSFALPIGLAGTLGYKYYNNYNNEEN